MRRSPGGSDVRTLVRAGAALAIIGTATWWYATRDPAGADRPRFDRRGDDGPVSVVMAAVDRKDVPVHVEGIGTVQASNTVLVRARVDGQLDAVSFREGQDVAAGDVLAQIDPRLFRAALAQAQAAKAKDEAQLANARLDLQRTLNLAQRAYATQQSVDTQKAQVAQLEAALQADQAMIDNAAVQLGYTTIRAPISGRTGVRLVDQGNIVHAGDPGGIVVITQLQPISVVFTLPQQTLLAVNAALARGEVPVTAFGSDRKTVLEQGVLSVVDNQIDSQTGTIKLKATFANAERKLWPGQFVNIRVRLDVRKNSIVVPAPAVQRNATGTFAYVVNPDRKVEMRPIKVAQIDEGIALVDSGLDPGQNVVVLGQDRLRPGAAVVASADEPPAATAQVAPAVQVTPAAMPPAPEANGPVRRERRGRHP
jgi:multidrug efflux system membrane fusion protein